MTKPALRKILVVDDEPDIRRVAELALVKIGGFEVELCNDGFMALANIAEVKPDIVLLDVMMPKMDGLETFEKLKQLPGFEQQPIIFMTAKVQPAQIDEYRALGAVEVIAKPFDPMVLSKQLEEIWLEIE